MLYKANFIKVKNLDAYFHMIYINSQTIMMLKCGTMLREYCEYNTRTITVNQTIGNVSVTNGGKGYIVYSEQPQYLLIVPHILHNKLFELHVRSL